VAEETVNVRLFVDRLIVPAHQQGVAGLFVGAGVDVKLYGRGWEDLAAFVDRHAGTVPDRGGLDAAVDACAALAHVWPAGGAHPIDAAGRPVLRRASKGKEAWLAEAKRLARGDVRGAPVCGPALTAEVLRRAISLPSPA
jgi:hypothetical protein